MCTSNTFCKTLVKPRTFSVHQVNLQHQCNMLTVPGTVCVGLVAPHTAWQWHLYHLQLWDSCTCLIVPWELRIMMVPLSLLPNGLQSVLFCTATHYLSSGTTYLHSYLPDIATQGLEFPKCLMVDHWTAICFTNTLAEPLGINLQNFVFNSQPMYIILAATIF